MAEQPVRVGIVGAGANTRQKHIPGFRAIEGVSVTGVVNRTPESTARAARELDIPKTYPTWQALIEDPEIDAVCIGTWPNLHCEVACAALAEGKHVLTEARMSANAAEAHQMLAASRAHPELVAQIVPCPYGLVHDQFIRTLMKNGYLAELREVVVIGVDDRHWDYTHFMHWRQDTRLSGLNALTLGMLHETLLRWIPAPTRVFAQTTIFEPTRPSPHNSTNEHVSVPESIQAITQIGGGARGIYHLSGVSLFGPGQQIHLYGRSGTLKLIMGAEEELWCGRVGDKELQRVQLPAEDRGGWRVEAEFVGAIRGTESVRLTDFAAGVQYMEFTEAIVRSAETNLPVPLPL